MRQKGEWEAEERGKGEKDEKKSMESFMEFLAFPPSYQKLLHHSVLGLLQ